MTFDVLVPTYKPGKEFEQLLEGILIQTKQPENIYIINTDKSFWKKEYEKILPIEIIHIEKKDFDHGGTRRMAASLSKADFFVCMTQDARPKDHKLFENLLSNFEDEKVAVAYARQETDENAFIIESFTREFNYPSEKKVKTKADVKTMGIKAWFSSDVCAMYRKSAYEEAGGFVSRTIFNEDMLMAYEVMERGYAVVYEPSARVIHYHNYSLRQQFQRNFDLGVSHREFHAIFSKASSEKEGIKLVKKTMFFLWKRKKAFLIPKLIIQSAIMLIGYKCGKQFQKLPKKMVQKFSMNKGYFQ